MNKYSIISLKTFNALLLIILIFSFLNLFNKGFDYSDESYYILSSIYPNDIKNFQTYFHFINNILFKLSFENLHNFRVSGFLVLVLSSLYFSSSFLKYHFEKQEKIIYNLYFKIICISSIIFYYFENLFTPSYNLINLSLILVFFGLFFKNINKNQFSFKNSIFFPICYFFLCINKVTSGLTLIPFIIFFLLKNFRNKKFYVFLIVSIFCFSILFLNNNINYIYEYFNNSILNYDQPIQSSENLKIDITIFNLIDVYNRIITYKFRYYYLAFFLFSILFKINLNSHLVLIILFKNFLLSAYVVWIDTFFIVLYNFLLLIIFRKKIYKHNLFYTIFFLFLCFTFYYGTNVELLRFFHQSSIFTFFGLAYLFIKNFKFKYKEVFINLMVFLIIFCAFNMKKIISKKEYLLNKPFNENSHNYISKYNERLFKNIKIRKELLAFNLKIEKIFNENGWVSGNILLDGTLKHPGFLLIANGKFIQTPWHFHKKEILLSSLNKLQNDDMPWLIINKKDLKFKYSIFRNFENLKFLYLGSIKHPYSKTTIEVFKSY